MGSGADGKRRPFRLGIWLVVIGYSLVLAAVGVKICEMCRRRVYFEVSDNKKTIGNTMIYRLSQTLAKKLKERTLPSLPLDENPYADWSAHLFTADRTQYIIVTNTKSLYSAVMHGKGITDDNEFIHRAVSNLREFMEADRLAFIYQRFVGPTSESVQFGKALNRSVTGSINELVKLAKFWLAEGELAPFDIGFKLNDILLSALARSKADFYWKPREAFKALADGLGPGTGGEA